MTEGAFVVKRLWAAQERRFTLWSPAMIGVGVWGRLEGGWIFPLIAVGLLFLGAVVAVVELHRRGSMIGVVVASSVMLMALGHSAGSLRIAAVDAPRLSEGFRGEVTGRVVEADRSRSNAPRVVLDSLSLKGVHSSAVPERVRITLVDAVVAPVIGSIIAVQAVVGPPSGPAAPGAFDFSRQAFFRQIGGVGYARGKVELRDAPEPGGWEIRLARLRVGIAQELREGMGGEEGAVAAALIVGDRSGISDDATEALRDSGLAHLLAISGLHIGLMSALTFWLVRFALALMPVFASRFPIRKMAAIAGLAAAAGYLALAGFGVATQRAFVMAAVGFTAILLDRPAVTARGLAAAACLVLLLRPESLFGAGFQMSFAAVAALVAGYEVTRPFWRRRAEHIGMFQRMLTGLFATIATSVIAGAATAPFAAYHFNRLVAFGLPANLLATPVMGLWIMPAIILTAVLTPLGLSGLGLSILGIAISSELWVAHAISGLEGAAWSVPAGTPSALALIVFGGLWLVIWRDWLRAFAALPFVAGVALWCAVGQPDLYIAEDARLIAGRTDQQALWMSRKRKSGYSAETWLRRNGEGDVSQTSAFEKRQWMCGSSECRGRIRKDVPVILIRNRSNRHLARVCEAGVIVIAPRLFWPQGVDTPCTLIDREILDGASSIAVTLSASQQPHVEIAKPTPLSRYQ